MSICCRYTSILQLIYKTTIYSSCQAAKHENPAQKRRERAKFEHFNDAFLLLPWRTFEARLRGVRQTSPQHFPVLFHSCPIRLAFLQKRPARILRPSHPRCTHHTWKSRGAHFLLWLPFFAFWEHGSTGGRVLCSPWAVPQHDVHLSFQIEQHKATVVE